MSVGFAGARTLDDRRRRRLAQNAEGAERRAPSRPGSTGTSNEPQFAASPIESLVRPQMWVTLLLATMGLGVCGGSVYLAQWTVLHYPSATASFGPHGLLQRSLATVFLVFGAQLAAAIHWYRARSRKDFNGRYRIWHFIVPSLLAFGFCTATDCHLVLSAWAQDHWQLTGSYARTLLWMIPTGTVLLAMVRLLHTEMRGTVGAAPSLWMAILAATGSAAVVLDAPIPVDAAIVAIAGQCVMLLWPLGLLLALLFYTRRVIYITNEPSALPSSSKDEPQDVARGWLGWWRPREATRRRKAKRDPDQKPQASDASDGQQSRAAAAKASSKETRQSAAASQPAKEPAVSAGDADAAQDPVAGAPEAPVTAEEQEPQKKRAEVRRSDRAHYDEYEEDEGDRQRTLSKKERRRLRKQQQRERREALN